MESTSAPGPVRRLVNTRHPMPVVDAACLFLRSPGRLEVTNRPIRRPAPAPAPAMTRRQPMAGGWLALGRDLM